MLTDQAMRDRMRGGWRAGQPFTVCGNGSTPARTEKIRKWLPDIVREYRIRTVNDAGAGDMAWMRGLKWAVEEYRPFDLFPRAEEVVEIDITTEVLPRADAILCRMVLNHLVDITEDGTRDEGRIEMALERFRESGSTYLIATQFDTRNMNDRSPQFARLDLSPYLGPYLRAMVDGHEEHHCRLAMWRL